MNLDRRSRSTTRRIVSNKMNFKLNTHDSTLDLSVLTDHEYNMFDDIKKNTKLIPPNVSDKITKTLKDIIQNIVDKHKEIDLYKTENLALSQNIKEMNNDIKAMKLKIDNDKKWIDDITNESETQQNAKDLEIKARDSEIRQLNAQISNLKVTNRDLKETVKKKEDDIEGLNLTLVTMEKTLQKNYLKTYFNTSVDESDLHYSIKGNSIDSANGSQLGTKSNKKLDTTKVTKTLLDEFIDIDKTQNKNLKEANETCIATKNLPTAKISTVLKPMNDHIEIPIMDKTINLQTDSENGNEYSRDENFNGEWHTIDETFEDSYDETLGINNNEKRLQCLNSPKTNGLKPSDRHHFKILQDKIVKIQNGVRENSRQMSELLDQVSQLNGNSNEPTQRTLNKQNAQNIEIEPKDQNYLDNSLTHSTHQPKNRQIKTQTKKKRYQNIYMYGDSHCRGLKDILENLVPNNCCINISSYPGKGITFIVDQIDCSNIGPNDLVCVMAGTNDLFWTNWTDMEDSFLKLQQKCANTNLLMIFLPPRYDKKYINKHIIRLNSKIKHCLEKENYNSTQFIDPTHFLDSYDYNWDRIHLNFMGKQTLCRKIIMKLFGKIKFNELISSESNYHHTIERKNIPKRSFSRNMPYRSFTNSNRNQYYNTQSNRNHYYNTNSNRYNHLNEDKSWQHNSAERRYKNNNSYNNTRYRDSQENYWETHKDTSLNTSHF